MDDLTVECYSGHTYAQEPRAWTWQGRHYRAVHIEQRWRTPDGPAFRLRTEGGERFELRYHELEDRWLIRTLARTHRPPLVFEKIRSKIEDKEVQR